jgi:hypothetical protein
VQKLNHWAEEQPGFRRSIRRREQCRKIRDNGTLYKAGRPQINRWCDLWNDCLSQQTYLCSLSFLRWLIQCYYSELTVKKTLRFVLRHTWGSGVIWTWRVWYRLHHLRLILRETNENACFYVVQELQIEVTSLKKELESVVKDMEGVTDTITELAHIKPLSTQLWEWQIKMLHFCTVVEQDTITETWTTPVSWLYWHWPNENYFDLHAVLELSDEVTSLKTELESMVRDMKGATDTTSELTIKNTFFTQPWEWGIKMLCFCTVLELDTITKMTNGKLLFVGFSGTDHMKTILIYT